MKRREPAKILMQRRIPPSASLLHAFHRFRAFHRFTNFDRSHRFARPIFQPHSLTAKAKRPLRGFEGRGAGAVNRPNSSTTPDFVKTVSSAAADRPRDFS
jgi:hypothetical protein